MSKYIWKKKKSNTTIYWKNWAINIQNLNKHELTQQQEVFCEITYFYMSHLRTTFK